MNTFLRIAAAGGILLATPAIAKDGQNRPDDDPQRMFQKTEQAAYNSCLGQGRAWWAGMLAGDETPVGHYHAQRAGDNPELDAYYRSVWCPRDGD